MYLARTANNKTDLIFLTNKIQMLKQNDNCVVTILFVLTKAMKQRGRFSVDIITESEQHNTRRDHGVHRSTAHVQRRRGPQRTVHARLQLPARLLGGAGPDAQQQTVGTGRVCGCELRPNVHLFACPCKAQSFVKLHQATKLALCRDVMTHVHNMMRTSPERLGRRDTDTNTA